MWLRMRFWSQTFEVDLSQVKNRSIADETQQIRQLLDTDRCEASLGQLGVKGIG